MTEDAPRVVLDALSEAESSDLLAVLPPTTRTPAPRSERSGQVPCAKDEWIPGLPAFHSPLYRFAKLLQGRCGVNEALAPASATVILYVCRAARPPLG